MPGLLVPLACAARLGYAVYGCLCGSGGSWSPLVARRIGLNDGALSDKGQAWLLAVATLFKIAIVVFPEMLSVLGCVSMLVQEPSEEPFDIDSVPKEVKSLPLAEKKAPSKKPTGLGATPTAPTSTVDVYEKLLSSIPEFSSFEKLFKVTIIVDASDVEEFTEVSTKPLNSLPYDSPGQTFVVFEKPEGVPTVGKFSNMLKFIVKEPDGYSTLAHEPVGLVYGKKFEKAFADWRFWSWKIMSSSEICYEIQRIIPINSDQQQMDSKDHSAGYVLVTLDSRREKSSSTQNLGSSLVLSTLREAKGEEVGSRGTECSSNPSKLYRNASATANMNNLASQSSSANPVPHIIHMGGGGK
ncbi:Coatomer subunit gamma [Camellia lanceoleosa]|nr:Coatomer subunit gamma [Camellia lanceoleosa]